MDPKLPFLTPVPEAKGYSFCEPVYALANRPWHIRKLTAVGRRMGGGIDTSFLCRDKRENGWDIDVPMSDHHLTKNACERCLREFVDQTGYKPTEEK